MPNPTGKGGFLPGQSGNKNGRPKGSTNAATKLRRQIEAHGDAILEKMIITAGRGNVIAGRFLIERILPAAKSAPLQTPVNLTGSLPEQADAVKAALAGGQITLDDATALLEAIGAVQAIKDAAEVQQRLADLEAKMVLLTGTPRPTAALPAPQREPDAQ